jgi:hypothetical protein
MIIVSIVVGKTKLTEEILIAAARHVWTPPPCKKFFDAALPIWPGVRNRLRIPSARLAPPVSTARRSATGFEASSSVGLVASNEPIGGNFSVVFDEIVDI